MMLRIILLGAGGTGSQLAPNLFRLAETLENDKRQDVQIIIADGDLVEEKNLKRQNFIADDVGAYKAECLAQRYMSAFEIDAGYVTEYIETQEALEALLTDEYGDQTVLIGCVDNNKTRKLCCEVFQHACDLIYIDAGNGAFAGQVVCGIRADGKTLIPCAAEIYPEMLEDESKFPSEISCAEHAQEDAQTIAANATAANIILLMLYNLLYNNDNRVEEATFSARSIRVTPRLQKPAEQEKKGADQ